MEDITPRFIRRSRLKYFLSLVAAALAGGLIVLSALPVLLPYMLPEPETQHQLPWLNHPEDASVLDSEYQQSAVVNAVNKVAPAVVGVTRMSQSGHRYGQTSDLAPSGHGSGVIISPDGYIVTNYHVVENAAEVIVTLSNGRELKATMVGEDPGTDLAVLKIDSYDSMPWASLGNSDALIAGEFVAAIGNPGGLDLERSVTFGIISATDRSLDVYDWVFGLVQTDAAINPGNSGGPLINMAGQVVGINSVKILDAEGLGFSIPSNLVKTVSQSLIEDGRVVRPMLGVSITEISPALAQIHSLKSDYGLLVVETPTGLPADIAGIIAEDIIIEVQGTAIQSLRDLRQVLSDSEVGETIEVTVLRGATTLTFEVVLADQSSL
ncbi:MAG: PDZ domain-containing protein [Firmicutes bacterium]|nr:PDZ domain-containing protein [Bacillota bacterium]